MSPLELEALAEILNRLPFVLWDRFTVDTDGAGVVYGWIARPDGRSDFVLLDFETDAPGEVRVGYTTSSAERSVEIDELLYGESRVHYTCQRVDEHFGDLVHNKAVAA